MRRRTYNKEIRNCLTAFISAMDNIVIARYNNDDSIGNFLQVNTYLSPKNRFINEARNPSGQFNFPATSFRVTGLSRDNERQSNKNYGIINHSFTGVDGFEYILEPNPTNLTVGMSIITTFWRDMEQIMNNFVPYFQPNIYVSTMEPYTSKELRHKVTWSGDISIDNPEDITSEDHFRYLADTSFTIETELYKARRKNIPAIQGISFAFIPTCKFECFDDDDFVERITSNNTAITSCKFYGDMQINNITPNCIEERNSDKLTFCIEGDLCKVDSLFLSGSNLDELQAQGLTVSSWNLFCLSQKCSAGNPEFRGIPLMFFKQISPNLVCFEMPRIPHGDYNIIAVNRCGYTTSDEFSGCNTGLLHVLSSYSVSSIC